MARPKRVPYRPDRFQEKGRKAASWVLDRQGAAIGAVVVLALGFVLAVVLVTRHSESEEKALSALYKYRGDLKRLEEALAQYGSTSARPFTLIAVANAQLRKPLDDEGQPKDETDAERDSRLGRAENTLRTLVREYPKHELHLYGLTLLAAVLEEKGEYAEAAKLLAEALEIAPATLEAKVRYDIGRLHVLMGQNDAARPYLLEARAKSSREIEIPSPYGMGSVRQKPAWFRNAEYLLARIGTGEKTVEFPESEPPKRPGLVEKHKVKLKPGGGPKPEIKAEPEAVETEKRPAAEKEASEKAGGKETAPREAAPAEGGAGGEAEGAGVEAPPQEKAP